jgi:hypothetical protein
MLKIDSVNQNRLGSYQSSDNMSADQNNVNNFQVQGSSHVFVDYNEEKSSSNRPVSK